MKLAILGNTPIALEAVLRFHSHGAAVTWFNPSDLDVLNEFESVKLDAKTYISDEGINLLKEAGLDLPHSTYFDATTWRNSYYLPLVDILRNHQAIKPFNIVSVTKRFLGPGEDIKGRSRFYDLFRIIYQVDPTQFINEQKAASPETFQRLSEEFVQSLQADLEMYEDFDLILDLRAEIHSGSLSYNGRALGETRVTTDKLLYAYEALKETSNFLNDSDIREVALVGSGSMAAEAIIRLAEWLKDPRSRLFVVSAECDPFEGALTQLNDQTRSRLEEVFHYMEGEFRKETEEFHSKLRDWQALDDFVQVKVLKPVEPIPRLNFFSGHNVSAIDQLLDRKRVFLTLEKPDFRDGVKHPDNNYLELKTIGVDRVLVTGAMRKAPILKVLDKDEVGFFDLKSSRPTLEKAWEKDLEKLKGIENEIFKLFSPAISG